MSAAPAPTATPPPASRSARAHQAGHIPLCCVLVLQKYFRSLHCWPHGCTKAMCAACSLGPQQRLEWRRALRRHMGPVTPAALWPNAAGRESKMVPLGASLLTGATGTQRPAPLLVCRPVAHAPSCGAPQIGTPYASGWCAVSKPAPSRLPRLSASRAFLPWLCMLCKAHVGSAEAMAQSAHSLDCKRCAASAVPGSRCS